MIWITYLNLFRKISATLKRHKPEETKSTDEMTFYCFEGICSR